MPLVPAEFALSKNLYAVHPQFLFLNERHYPRDKNTREYNVYAKAIWFRRRPNGDIAAFFGTMWDDVTLPKDAGRGPEIQDFIDQYHGYRYAAEPMFSWDGQQFRHDSKQTRDDPRWQAREPDAQAALAAYPALPEGYLGWYRIELDPLLRAMRGR